MLVKEIVAKDAAIIQSLSLKYFTLYTYMYVTQTRFLKFLKINIKKHHMDFIV